MYRMILLINPQGNRKVVRLKPFGRENKNEMRSTKLPVDTKEKWKDLMRGLRSTLR